MARSDLGEADDAVAAAIEGVAKFAGHRDAMRLRRAEPAREIGERRIEAAEALPERGRGLRGGDDAAVLDARGFQVRPADVPADGRRHDAGV